jgi:nitrogen regulatory protein PII
MAKEKSPQKNLLSKLFSRRKAAPEAPKPEKLKLKLIFFIVDWHEANTITSMFVEEKVRFHFVSMGRGTASSDVLDILGIGAAEKAVVICLEQEVLVPVLMKEATKKLGFNNPGAGIAFTVPLSAINTPILQVFKQSIHKNEKIAEELGSREAAVAAAREKRTKTNAELPNGGTMSNEYSHDLIISIINQGYTDDFMNAAREAGATGGTVISARGQAHSGTVKFFGISVQAEKEVIIILSSREKKTGIMRAVSEAFGINSKAEGIVFSVPVDSITGLDLEKL